MSRASLVEFCESHAAAITAVFPAAEAAQWGVTRDRFAERLHESVQHRFGAAPDPRAVDEYLRTLHAADLTLACACMDGVEDAWAHFISAYRPDLYRAARAVAAEGEARELADSIYADLYGLEERDGVRRSLFRYFHGRSRLTSWLRSVLAQRRVDGLRAARRFESLDSATGAREPAAEPAAHDPARALFLTKLSEAIAQALAALDPRDRLRLSYYYVHQLTLAQIGRLFSEHEATASRKLDKARKRLRADVEAHLQRQGLSQPEIRECFAYAQSDWAFDLPAALAEAERGAPPAAQGAVG
jgi:RNA polymerase sigma-70 factor (ECF subfamily)